MCGSWPAPWRYSRSGGLCWLWRRWVTITGGAGSNQGYFQMQNDALMSYSAGGPFAVLTGDKTLFVNLNGLAGLQQAGTPNLISRGLVFKNPVDGKPVVVAARVRVLPAGQ